MVRCAELALSGNPKGTASERPAQPNSHALTSRPTRERLPLDFEGYSLRQVVSDMRGDGSRQ